MNYPKLKSKPRLQRREQSHIVKGFSKPKPKMDPRPEFKGTVADMVDNIVGWRKWGDSEEAIRKDVNGAWKNGREMYEEAMKIISSPLFEAMKEGNEETSQWTWMADVNVPSNGIYALNARYAKLVVP